MTIAGATRVINDQLTATDANGHKVPVMQSPSGLNRIRTVLERAGKETTGGLHLIDISTFVVAAQEGVLKQLSRAPLATVRASVGRAGSEAILRVNSVARGIFGPSATIHFVSDHPLRRPELKRSVVLQRMIGAELRHRREVARRAPQANRADASRPARRDARKQAAGHSACDLQDVYDSQDLDADDMRAEGQPDRRTWAVSEIGSISLEFPPQAVVIEAEHEADPKIARAARAARDSGEFAANEIFVWSADSDSLLNVAADICETVVSRVQPDSITFVDRVAMEQSAPFAPLTTTQARLFAGILGGVDYEGGIPQHRLSSVLRSPALVDLCARGWTQGQDVAFDHTLAAALATYCHKDQATQAAVRNYRIPLSRMLEISALMRGEPVAAGDLFEKANLVPTVLAAAADSEAGRQPLSVTSSTGADCIWPRDPPAETGLPETPRPPPQRPRPGERRTTLGRHAGRIPFKANDIPSPALADLPQFGVDWAKRYRDAEGREQASLVEAANTVANGKGGSYAESTSRKRAIPEVTQGGESEQGGRKAGTSDESAENEAGGAIEDGGANDAAASPDVHDYDSGDEDAAKMRTSYRHRTQTPGYREPPYKSPKPTNLKSMYAIRTLTAPLASAFTRLAVPWDDLALASSPVVPPPPDLGDPGSASDADQIGGVDVGAGAGSSGTVDQYFDGGQALRTALETHLRQHGFEVDLLVPVFQATVRSCIGFSINHRWVHQTVAEGQRNSISQAILSLARLARAIQTNDLPVAADAASLVRARATVLELSTASICRSSLPGPSGFDPAWDACPPEVWVLLAKCKLPVQAYCALRERLGSPGTRISVIGTAAAVHETVVSAYETSVYTTLRTTAAREGRLLVEFLLSDLETNVSRIVPKEIADQIPSRPPELDYLLVEFETGRSASKSRLSLRDAVFQAWEDIPITHPISDGSTGHTALTACLQSWVVFGKRVPGRLKNADADEQHVWVVHVSSLLALGLESVRQHLLSAATGSIATTATLGSIVGRGNKGRGLPAASSGLILRVLRGASQSLIPTCRATSVPFDSDSISSVLSNFASLAETFKTNVQERLNCVETALCSLQSLHPAEHARLMQGMRAYPHCHRALQSMPMIKISRAERDPKAIWLAGLHDARILRCETGPGGAAGRYLPTVALESSRTRQIVRLCEYLRRSTAAEAKAAADASSAWISILFSIPARNVYVPNGTGVITHASISIAYRDLRRIEAGFAPSHPRDPILRFNQALATPALSSAGLAKFGPIRDLISRSFVQIEGSLREGRLVPIALPWSIKGTRLTYSATSRFPGPAPNPPPGARAQVYDPRRLDIASLRPLNYENAFLDARRAFSPLTEQEEAEVTAAESLEKAATAAAGADMKARTRATNSLEQDFSRRRDRQLVECLSGCDRISQDSIFVGVDPGERYALAATVFSRGSSDQPRMPRAYTVRSTSISEIDKQEQQVQALWQQSSHLVRIQSAVCAALSLGVKEFSACDVALRPVQSRDPIQATLAYQARHRRQADLLSLADRIVDDIIRSFPVSHAAAAESAEGRRATSAFATRNASTSTSPPQDASPGSAPFKSDTLRRVCFFIGESSSNAKRTHSASGADRRRTMVPLLLAAFNRRAGLRAHGFLVNEAYSTKSCPDPDCRERRERTAVEEAMQHPIVEDSGRPHYRLLQCLHCGRRFHRDVCASVTIAQIGIVQFVSRKLYMFGRAVRTTLRKFGRVG